MFYSSLCSLLCSSAKMIIKTVARTKAIVVSSCIYKLSEIEKLERLEKIMKKFKITFLFNKFRKTYGIIKFRT